MPSPLAVYLVHFDLLLTLEKSHLNSNLGFGMAYSPHACYTKLCERLIKTHEMQKNTTKNGLIFGVQFSGMTLVDIA